MLRIQTSFQDSPGDGYYIVLYHEGRPLEEQLTQLGLRNGDKVVLWEPDCGDYTVEATLLFDFLHPLGGWPRLWAKETSTEPLSDARVP